MENKIWETNDSHYQLFKEECDYWVEKYGLFEWEIIYRHHDIGQRASCEVSYTSKICLLALGTKWNGIEPTIKKVGASAYHEVIELMLTEITSMSKRECCVFEQDIDEKLHSVIKRLENVHWKNDREEYYNSLTP